MVKPPGADAGGRAACGTMASMETIKRHDTGAAVEDVQQRLATIGLLDQAAVDGSFGEQTAAEARRYGIRTRVAAQATMDALIDIIIKEGNETWN